MGETGERVKSPVEEVKRKANKMTAEQLTCEDRRQKVRLEPHVRTLLSPIPVGQLWCCRGKRKAFPHLPNPLHPIPQAGVDSTARQPTLVGSSIAGPQETLGREGNTSQINHPGVLWALN